MYQLFVDFVSVIGGRDIFAHTVSSGMEHGSRTASEFHKVLHWRGATRTFIELSSNGNSLRLNVFYLIKELIFQFCSTKIII